MLGRARVLGTRARNVVLFIPAVVGGPFHETVRRAAQIVTATIEARGSFTVTCLGGILSCRL